jgi:spore germination protein GerM
MEQNEEILKNNDSEESIQDVLVAFRESFDRVFDIELDMQSNTFNFIPINEDLILELGLIFGVDEPGTESAEEWNNLVKVFVENSKLLSEDFPGYAISFVGSLENTDTRLLTVMNGVVTYNYFYMEQAAKTFYREQTAKTKKSWNEYEIALKRLYSGEHLTEVDKSILGREWGLSYATQQEEIEEHIKDFRSKIKK